MTKSVRRWVRVKELAKDEKAAIGQRCDRFIAEQLTPRFLPETRPTQWNFCKHMVATALVANESMHRGDEVPDRVGEIAGNLAQLDKPQLEKLLLEMVASDWRALRSLSFALGCDWVDDFD